MLWLLFSAAWLSQGQGALLLPEQGGIHPQRYQRHHLLKHSRGEGCSGPTTCQSNPRAITWAGASFRSLHHPKGERRTPHPDMHLQHGDPTYTHRHTTTEFFPTPYSKQGSPHTRSPTRFTPRAQRSSCPLPPLSTPQPSHARAHLLLDSPVCLPKVFAAGGTCFDTISSAKEAAHLA